MRGVLLVLLLSFVVYLPSVGGGFVLDDDPMVNSITVTNLGRQPDPMITAHWDDGVFAYLGKFFTRPYWWPETYNDGLYRPVSVLSYGLVYQLFSRPFLSSELEAMPQHAVNVLLHLWAVWLVMAMLTRVGASGFVSLLTGLLFGVHAIHSEVVAGIVGRAEILSFCFGAQAMLLFNRGGWWRYLLGGLCMYLAYGSKESSFAWIGFFFCFQLTYGWIRHPDQPWLRPLIGRDVLFATFAMLLPIGLWAGLRSLAMDFEPPVTGPADWSSNPLGHVADSTRILTAVKIWGFASWLCVLPYPLSCLYSPEVFQILESPWDIGFLTSLLWILGFLTAGLWFGRRVPLLFFAMTCFLGFSLLTSNVPLAIGTIFGERLYYTPSLGICLLPGIIWPLLRTRGHRVFLVIVSMWCAGNMVMAIHRTILWKDNATLFVADVVTYPMSIDLHRKCASVYGRDGPQKDFEKAIAHLKEAKRIMPTYVHAFRELGKIYSEQREWDKAIGELEQALVVGLDYGDPVGAESIAYVLIGDCMLGKAADVEDVERKRQLCGEAQTWYSKALEAPPWGDAYGQSYNKLGDCLIVLSDLETDESAQRPVVAQALTYYRKTIDLGQDQQPSRRAAFRRLVQHVVRFPSPLLPKTELTDLYMLAKDSAGEDYELALLMGAMAYKANLSAELVFSPLHWAIENYPEDKKDLEFYKAHLFYADVLGELGNRDGATRVLKMLLARPDFPEDYKKQIRAKHGLR
ncbi:MAG: tetratricopeptide repeat protein [Planctomycetota bacterium]|nr:tetratricopeptide repeat protein [Planctomycetota bacterium]